MDAVALFCERARAHDPDFELSERERERRRGDLPSRRRPPAGDRAGGGPLRAALPGRDRHAPARRARRTRRRATRRARPPPDAARDDRLEPQPAQRRRESVLRALRGVRRRRHRAGARRRSPAPTSTRSTGSSPRACSCAASPLSGRTRLGNAGDDPGVRRRALRGELQTANRFASATSGTSSRWLNATGRDSALFGPNRGRSTSRLWTPRSTTSAPPSSGRSSQDSARSQALELSAALVDYWMRRDRYAEASRLGRAGAPEVAAAAIRRCAPAHCAGRAGRCGHSGAGDERACAVWRRPRRSPGRWRIPRPWPYVSLQPRRAESCAVSHDVAAAARRRGAGLRDKLTATRGLIAMAAWARAQAARSADELRDRVDQAASLLERTGNGYQLATLFHNAPPARRCAGAAMATRAVYLQRAVPLMRAARTRPYQWMLLRGNFGLAALLAGDTEAATRRVPRGARALPRARRPARGSRSASPASPRSRRSTTNSNAPRGLPAPPPHIATATAMTPRSMSGSTRPFSRPHGTAWDADAWDAALREGAALDLQGRDRLRPRRTPL